MKREIKFRMWVKESKVMMFHRDINYGHVLDYKESHDDIELMQFTGLKDKKENDVYFGDVLNKKTTFENNMADRRFQPATQINVGFENGSFVDTNTGRTLFDAMRTVSSFQHENWTEYEIIGNIYANPELK